MLTELTDDATHEDIQDYVDDVVADVENDRASEETTDSQKVASDDVVTDTSAETDSGSEAAESRPGKGEKTGKDRSWIDDDLKAEASAYGIDEAELADFTSREEFDRATRLFDTKALEAGRESMSEEDEDEDAVDDPYEDEDEAGRHDRSPSHSDGAYEVSLDKDIYDEDLVDEFTRMRDHYESRMSALESHFQSANAVMEEQRFDAAIEELGHSSLFGKTGSENGKQLQRRVAVHEAMVAQLNNLGDRAREGDYDYWVGVMARGLFADDFTKRELKNRTRKISKQANGRQGGGATRPTDPPETVRDEMRQLYAELNDA